MRILGSSLEPSWLFMEGVRSGLRNIDRCSTRSGLLSRTWWRTPNHKESSLDQMRDQPPPWHGRVTKASPSVFFLRTVTAYRLEKFCVNYKITNTFHIHILLLLYSSGLFRYLFLAHSLMLWLVDNLIFSCHLCIIYDFHKMWRDF